MDPLHEKLAEEEFLHDDSTSCTSSLATSLSEDPDDLHLGAEANSFDVGLARREDRQKGESIERKIKPDGSKLIICRDRYSSFESCGTSHTLSSIDSVRELIVARECDASEVLFHLGFATQDQEEAKRDILSRFSLPSFCGTENTVTGEGTEETVVASEPRACQTILSDSIHKTEEWLANRQQPNPAEEPSGGAEAKNKAAATTDPGASATSKRIAMQRVSKLRRKFSKSRQSSFEMLPKLKEEDSTTEANCDETSSLPPTTSSLKDEAAVDSVFSPIRESSLERNLSIDGDGGGDRRPSSVGDSFVNSKTNVSSSSSASPSHETPFPAVLSHAVHLAKTSLLATRQLDSFELEEIASIEDATEFQKLRLASPARAATRRVGVIRVPPDLAANSVGIAEKINREMASESDGNESSSGFDEDDVNHMNSISPVHQNFERRNLPGSVADNAQKPCSCSLNQKPSEDFKPLDDVIKDGTLSPRALASTSSSNTNCNNSFTLHNGHPPSTAFVPNGVALRCSAGASRAKRCVLVPQPRSPGNTRPQHKLSDARRRRREFAARSALSGDSLSELAHSLPGSTSLVYHNGGYFYRKRRPGGSCFCRSNSVSTFPQTTPLQNGVHHHRHAAVDNPTKSGQPVTLNRSLELKYNLSRGDVLTSLAPSPDKNERVLQRAATFSCSQLSDKCFSPA